MTRHTIKYKSKDSYLDFGITVESVKIDPPVPRKTEVTIPFSNSCIDMDEVVGYSTYDDRNITVKMWKKLTSVEAVKKCQQDIITWLLSDTKKSELKDNTDLYYYKAYCSQLDFHESTSKIMQCVATFKANPYKYNKMGEESI